jgi:hypothetical protein
VNLRKAWKRASVRRAAERQGASREAALALADALYPVEPPVPVVWVGDFGEVLDAARDYDERGPYL